MDASIVAEKLCSKCGLLKSLTNFDKSLRYKSGFRSDCKDCRKNYRIANKEKIKISLSKWYQANKEKMKLYSIEKYKIDRNKKIIAAKQWQKDNPEKKKIARDKWKQANLEKHKNCIDRWNKANPHRIIAKTAKRRAKKTQAMPTWADITAIRLEYELAAWCTKVTGEKYHVDHIIPLQGKNVCGLHVHNNLRVVLALENLTKSNKFDVL